MSTKATDNVDLEAGESTPLVGSDEPPPLEDMKEISLKEKAITAVAGVSCKCVCSIDRSTIRVFCFRQIKFLSTCFPCLLLII